MTRASFDLDTYLERIGYSGSQQPTLETLAALHAAHPRAIAFENLDPLVGWPVRLDAGSIFQKLVRNGRGGYCFEQNLLFSHCLEHFGFEVTWLAARVLWNNPPGTTTARSHMVLLIDMNGDRYVADVGFGGLTLTAPLRLRLDIEQTTPHETFRIRGAGGTFVVEASLGAGWKALYRFDLQPQVLPDYEVTSWYLSNHPASHFVTNLMAGRPDIDLRYALRNNELSIHRLNGTTDRRLLQTADELRQALVSEFRLTLPDSPDLDAALHRLTLGASRPLAAT
jgi:N-hydroxyarylamine O-acetyltransferase